MPLIRVAGIVRDRIIETTIPLIRPIVKYYGGYIKLINNDGYVPYYEFTRVPVIEIDINDMEQSISAFEYRLQIAMTSWFQMLRSNNGLDRSGI